MHADRDRAWYDENKAGSLTASGEKYDPRALTAAHRKLPFGTQLNVINLENGRSVSVRINDRGPYLNNRILDLSNEAARRLGK
jgi:rare lipoprotein A